MKTFINNWEVGKLVDAPENSPDAIDARIDALLTKINPASPFKPLLSNVYRPFCKTMVKLADEEYDPREVTAAVTSLIANLIRETALSTSPNPQMMKYAILKRVRALIESEK